MICPQCKNTDLDTKVLDSRASSEHSVVRRRRQCPSCGFRFTTYEEIVSRMRVIKKDRRRVPFDRAKLRRSVDVACRKRPISADDLDRLVFEIEQSFQEQRSNAEVTSEAIGQAVMERLKALDHVAYVRFASVYRDFRDASDFLTEVEALRLSPDRKP